MGRMRCNSKSACESNPYALGSGLPFPTRASMQMRLNTFLTRASDRWTRGFFLTRSTDRSAYALRILTIIAASAVLFGQQPQPGFGQPQVLDPNDLQDQPGQPVARLGVVNGDASVRRGDSGDWIAAAMNAPLMAGDSVSVAPGGSAELQLDYANFFRIGGDSEIRISQFDNSRQQVQVSRGLVTWRVLRDTNGSNIQSEISTPAVAVHPLRLSEVRVEVAADGATRIIVRRGDAEISTPRGTERIHEGNMMLVRGGADDPEYQIVYAPARDGWDSFNDQRDSYLQRAQSNQYVSPDVNGAEDLDAYGRWGYDPAYGNVWTPAVPPNWAPYQNGQCVWEDYYGWTWVDYDPWGWAPFHYGSWYFRTGFGWSWFPGPRYGRYWWHPAMVGFFGFGGGFGVGFGFGNVGWVPLAPFEVFHPWYGGGFGRRDGRFGVAGNVVANANIGSTFRNARIAGGVTAVSAQDFQRGAFRNQIAVNRAQLSQVSLVRGALPVAPTASNLRFSERPVAAAAIPRNEAGNQRFFSRMPAATSSQRTPFVQQQAAVRSAIGGGGIQQGASAGAGSGWRRFGEPSPSGGAPRVQPRGFQPSPTPTSPNPNGGPSPGAGAGWDRFGTPQRSAAPPQQQYGRPNNNYGGNSYREPSAPSRALQVAPPIVQQRAPAPSYGGAPQGYRGGGGGGRPSGGGGGHASGAGGHGGRR
jgi:uncharacterized protein DUF6600